MEKRRGVCDTPLRFFCNNLILLFDTPHADAVARVDVYPLNFATIIRNLVSRATHSAVNHFRGPEIGV